MNIGHFSAQTERVFKNTVLNLIKFVRISILKTVTRHCMNNRESDYALRILRALSDHQLHSINEISQEHQIPRQFAYQIASKLGHTGWIELRRGAKGGCLLKAELEEKTLKDLLEDLDCAITISWCLMADQDCPWRQAHKCGCSFHEEFLRIQDQLDKELESTSLAVLIARQDMEENAT